MRNNDPSKPGQTDLAYDMQVATTVKRHETPSAPVSRRGPKLVRSQRVADVLARVA